MNMGIIQAKAERLKGQELADYIKGLNLSDKQKEQVRSHLRTVARLRK